MMIQTEPIGSIPRPPELVAAPGAGDAAGEQLERLYEEAVRETVPFCDDRSITRDPAFAKIRARVEGTALAAAILEGRP